MEQVVRSIRLYGSLGAKFGREHRYVVGSPREALRALGIMIPGFWRELCDSGDRGVRYAVFVDQRNLSEMQLGMPADGDVIRIAPVIAGSKTGGVFQTIAGFALAAAGAASMFIVPGNGFGIDMMLMGASLALGGIAQLVSPQTPTPSRVNQHGMPGIQNVLSQGGPVPLLYGRMRVGSTVISESLKAIDSSAGSVQDEDNGLDSAQDCGAFTSNRYFNSKVIYNAIDLVSEGEIEGLVVQGEGSGASVLRSVYLDNVPLKNFDGTDNFEIDNFFYRRGESNQLPFDSKAIDSAANEVHVGIELRRRSADEGRIVVPLPWVLELDEPDVDEVALMLCFSDQRWDDRGKISNASVTVEFTASYPSDPNSKPDTRIDTIDGVCHSYRKTYVFTVEAGKPFRLQIKRTDPIGQGDNAKKKHGKVHVDSYTKRRTGQFAYPRSALMALQITSEKFDRIPVRSYDLKGLIVDVPSNYDPIKRVYVGSWDGTYKRAWTDNPAWILRDVLLNRRYGAGAWMNETSVDRYGLYEIAKYCDQSVPNGDGGTEPRFSCNCHITSRTHAFALLQQLASVFRGIVYWSAGTVLSSADMPSDPVYVYNPTNVVNGIFKYTGSSLKSRYTAVAVTWCNPHNGYKGAVETVEDAEGIALYGHNAAEITTFGCTSRSQAQRAGHWLLQTSKCETETVTFGVGLDGVLALPGQVIEVADPLRSPLPVGGRIVDIDASGRVVLDREVRAQRGDYITLMMPDAKAHRVEISEASGTAVTLSVPLAQRPVRGAAWTLKSSGVATRLFRVVSVSEMTEGTAFSISAATHRPEKFAAVDNAATSNVIYDRYVPVDSPRNLQIQAVQGPNMEMAARVSWDLVKDAQQYNLEVSGPKGRREVVVVKSPDREVVFSDIQPGAYAAKVTAQAWDGRLSVIAHTEAVLAGLVYVEGFWSETISDRSVLLFEVKNAWDVPDWFIELRLSETENFDQSTETILGRTRDTFISIDRRRKGFAWARARYGKGECSLFSASAWYPSETGAGEPFGKD